MTETGNRIDKEADEDAEIRPDSKKPFNRDNLEIELLNERIRSLKHEVDRLVEQRPLLLAALRYQHMGDLMRIALQVMLAIFGLVLVVALGAAIWSAQHDNDLVFEAFSVPPDFVQRGWNGQVVASQMLDKLSLMQEQTSTARAASTYLNNWGRDDIKVAIPQAGISIGDLNRYLREWLGHETHINGEIVRTDKGIAVTARVGGDAGETFTGPESKLADLLTWSARSIYRRTQPYRYAVFIQNGLGAHNASNEKILDTAAAVFLDLLTYGPPSEAKWAHLGLANIANAREDFHTAVREAQASLYYDPQFGMAYNILALNEQGLGHDEAAYAALTKGLASLHPGRDKQVVAADALVLRATADGQRSFALGDYRTAAQKYLAESRLDDYGGQTNLARIFRVQALALNHDGTASAEFPKIAPRGLTQFSEWVGTMLLVPSGLSNWNEAAVEAAAIRNWYASISDPKSPHANSFIRKALAAAMPCRILPLSAIAFAHAGDFADAEGFLKTVPGDCYFGLRARAQVMAMKKDWSGAEKWFGLATAQAPSIPFAYADWGSMLMGHGDFDGAIAKFTMANQKGPHFADPLEMWGEALIAKNRSDLGLAKFEEANKYAPNWGRLHLRWGEALLWSGDKGAAQKQFAVAATLNLAPAEKSELARVQHG